LVRYSIFGAIFEFITMPLRKVMEEDSSGMPQGISQSTVKIEQP
jgi:hypothetical protein